MTKEYHRSNEEQVVTEVSESRVNFGSWSWPRDIFPDDVGVGERYIVQSVLGSTPSGIFRCTWYKTDEELEADHRAMVAKFDADRQASLEANREDWARREAALPEPLRARLENFRAKAAAVGNNFDANGWGYELVVAELAVLYARQEVTAADDKEKFTDTDEIMAYAHREGTSGNQHDFAKALARCLIQEPAKVGETIAALSPLGSGAYYDAREE